MYLYCVLNKFILWFLPSEPSSINRFKIILSAFLNPRSILSEQESSHSVYFSILSESILPLEPSWPNKLFSPMSIAWSFAAFDNSSLNINFGTDFCRVKNLIFSYFIMSFK